ADRGRGSRQPGAGPAGARPSPRDRSRRIGATGGPRARPRQAGRLRRLPRRRQHHAVGLRVAGRTCGAVRAAMSFPDIVPELKARLPKLRGRLMANQSLAELTWFRVGGPAQVLFVPEDEADLACALGGLPRELPVTVVGLGSNLIVRDGGVPGVVIRLGRGFSDIAVEGARLRVGAAVPDVRVARAAQEAGVAGLAFMRGIPGAIGGALRMNGGAYGRETKDGLIGGRGGAPARAGSAVAQRGRGDLVTATAASPRTWCSRRRCCKASPAIRPR